MKSDFLIHRAPWNLAILVKKLRSESSAHSMKMKPFAKDILSKICESKLGIEMQALSLYMQSSPQKLNHHINSFINSGLVEKTKNGRNVVLVATEQGKLLYSWIAEDTGF